MSDKSHRLEPARTIIKKLGGVSAVAQAADVSESRVRRWMYPESAGGTGGLVPAKRQAKLLAWAKANQLPLRPADFFSNPARSGAETRLAS